MPLFVQLFPEHKLTPELTDKINNQIRRKATPRHVPDEIIHVPEIPVSHTNKRLEVPIKRLYLGMDLKKSLNIGSVSNPDALQWFVDQDRKSTRLNSSHVAISYAVFCLKKKK